MKTTRLALAILLISVFIPASLASQDIIQRKRGEDIKAIIIKADSNVVSYYMTEDTLRNIYFLESNYIDKIIFSSGEERTYKLALEDHGIKPIKSNIIQVNLFGTFVFSSINFRYEKIQKNGMTGLFVGAGIGLNPEEIIFYEHYDHSLSVWGFGTMRSVLFFESGINFYTPQFAIFKIGTGISIHLAAFNTRYYPNNSSSTPESKVKTEGYLMFNNQIRIVLSESIQIYFEADLSILRNLLENTIIHMGVAASF